MSSDTPSAENSVSTSTAGPVSANAASNTANAPARPRAVEAEIRLFCQSCRLTPRETEVVIILAEGITRIKDIAERLSLSPNTVNNHVNSIFLKTKTRSKSQLLAILLNRIAEDLHWARWLRQHPRVLFVLQPHDAGALNLIPEALERPEHLFRSRVVDSSSDWAVEVRKYMLNFIVYELKSGEACDKFIAELSSITNVPVVLLTDGDVQDESRCRAMHDGAIDLLAKTQAETELLPLLLSHFIEEDNECWNYIETATTTAGGFQVRQSHRALGKISSDQYGRGGFFLSAKDLQTIFDDSLSTGDWIEFGIDFGAGVKGQARGRVSWIRKADKGAQRAGAGFRVVSLDEPLRKRFAAPEYAGKSAYIPDGAFKETNLI